MFSMGEDILSQRYDHRAYQKERAVPLQRKWLNILAKLKKGDKEALHELVRLADPWNGWQPEYRSLVQWFSLKKNRLVDMHEKEDF